ncbi:hypothetical protein V2J09_011034 [Rumex salicifolius]
MVDIEPVVEPNGSQNAGVESVQVALTPAMVIDEQNITPPSVQQDDISGSMTDASPKASDKAKSLAISNMKKGGTEASCSNHFLLESGNFFISKRPTPLNLLLLGRSCADSSVTDRLPAISSVEKRKQKQLQPPPPPPP